MFNWTLGKRIATGIALMIVLMAIVGGAGYYGLGRVLGEMALYRDISALKNSTASIKEQSDQYLLAVAHADQKLQKTAHARTLTELDKGLKAAQKIQKNASLNEKGRNRLAAADEQFKKYREAINTFVVLEGKKASSQKTIEEIQPQIVQKINAGELEVEEMQMAMSFMKGHTVAYLGNPSKQKWEEIQTGEAKLSESIKGWHEKISNSEELSKIAKQLGEESQKTYDALAQHYGFVREQHKQMAAMDGAKNQLYAIAADLGAISEQTLLSQAKFSNMFIIYTIIIAVLLGIAYAIVLIRKIVGQINIVIDGIAEGANQVASASKEVSTSSQHLAEGSANQAASIEETSASLEEISSMVKQNAENAREAKGMMSEVKEIVDKVSKHMEDMTSAIDDISKSSYETDKIVKTIDEIAFQTNLLALNAAVEAARAGEAGAGFAVVADEVRNLAMRAAEAAKNTAQLIGDTIKAVKNGNELTHATKEAFHENIEISSKVGSLIDEIAEASREQSEGVDQVSKAVSSMDSVTQQNAAGAEESASSSEEMYAQSESMKTLVDDLARIIHGSKGKFRKALKAPAPQKAVSSAPKKEVGRLKKTTAAPMPEASGPKKKEVRPEEVIPMDEDFEDF